MIAHITGGGAGGGGGNGALRFFVLIGGFGVLALAARIRAARRADRAWLPWVVGGLGLAMVVFGLVVPQKKQKPIYLTLLEPEPGSSVPANQDVTLRTSVYGATVAATPAAKTGGHLHLYVDGKLESMPYGSDAVVRLTPGRHKLRIEYVDNKHRTYNPPVQIEGEFIAIQHPQTASTTTTTATTAP